MSSAGGAVLSGYLHKRGGKAGNKGWKKRWFILNADTRTLLYYRSRDAAEAIKGINIDGYRAEMLEDAGTRYPFVLESDEAGSRTLFLYANSSDERRRWIYHVREVVRDKDDDVDFDRSKVPPVPRVAPAPSAPHGVRLLQPAVAPLLQGSGSLSLAPIGSYCGKTCLCERWGFDQFDDDDNPTVQDDYLCELSLAGRSMKVTIIDVGSMPEYASIRVSTCYTRADALLLCYSITNSSTFRDLGNLFDEMQDNAPGCRWMLVGTHLDIDFHRQVPRNIGMLTAAVYGVPFYETSAKTRRNVEPAFSSLIHETLAARGEWWALQVDWRTVPPYNNRDCMNPYHARDDMAVNTKPRTGGFLRIMRTTLPAAMDYMFNAEFYDHAFAMTLVRTAVFHTPVQEILAAIDARLETAGDVPGDFVFPPWDYADNVEDGATDAFLVVARAVNLLIAWLEDGLFEPSLPDLLDRWAKERLAAAVFNLLRGRLLNAVAKAKARSYPPVLDTPVLSIDDRIDFASLYAYDASVAIQRIDHGYMQAVSTWELFVAAGFFGHGQSAAEVVADPPSTLEAGGFLDQWVEWTEGLSLMVATKVVAEGALSHRAALLSIWLSIAQRLYSQGCFNACTAIISGLKRPEVARLRHTWGAISDAYRSLWKSLSHIITTSANGCEQLQSLLWGHMKDKPIVPAVRELLNDLVILRRGMAGVPPRTPDGLIDFSAVEQVSNFLTLFQDIRSRSIPAYDVPEPLVATFLHPFGHASTSNMELSLALEPMLEAAAGDDGTSDGSDGRPPNSQISEGRIPDVLAVFSLLKRAANAIEEDNESLRIELGMRAGSDSEHLVRDSLKLATRLLAFRSHEAVLARGGAADRSEMDSAHGSTNGADMDDNQRWSTMMLEANVRSIDILSEEIEEIANAAPDDDDDDDDNGGEGGSGLVADDDSGSGGDGVVAGVEGEGGDNEGGEAAGARREGAGSVTETLADRADDALDAADESGDRDANAGVGSPNRAPPPIAARPSSGKLVPPGIPKRNRAQTATPDDGAPPPKPKRPTGRKPSVDGRIRSASAAAQGRSPLALPANPPQPVSPEPLAANPEPDTPADSTDVAEDSLSSLDIDS